MHFPLTQVASELIEEIDLPDLYCKFLVYRISTASCSQGEIRLYVAIDHPTLYDEVEYIPCMEITYSREEYKDYCSTKEDLIENLSLHYLTSHLLSRRLDEYFH